MKKLILSLLISLLSLPIFAQEQQRGLDLYQERCAKEKDPVKRRNYCYLLDRKNSNAQANLDHLPLEIDTV